MVELKNAAELRAATQQTLIDFLRTDLALCFTFAALVTTEFSLGDIEAAERLFSKAEQGHATIGHFLTDVQDTAHRHEIGQKLADLRARLDALKRKYGTFQKG